MINGAPLYKSGQTTTLRGEFFNFFNHVNFDESTAAGTFAKLSKGKGTFGALTPAPDPRIGQIGLKVIF